GGARYPRGRPAGRCEGVDHRSGAVTAAATPAPAAASAPAVAGRAVQRRVERAAGRGWLVGQAGGAAPLAVGEGVVADGPGSRRVNVDGDGPGLVIHPVEALAGDPDRLPGAVLAPLRRPADGERLVPGAAFDHVDADTRAGVVVVAGVARLPPQ